MSSELTTKLNLRKLNLVDNRTKWLIAGFVREMETLLTLTVPELILVICTFYFYPFESFMQDNCGPDVILDGKCAKYEKGSWNTVYGNIIIDGSISNAVYKWTIKSIAVTGNIMTVGITSSFNEMTDNPFNNRKSESYGISQLGWIRKGKDWWDRNENGDQGRKFKAGDIICIKVNISSSTIQFYKNDLKIADIKIENMYTSKFKLAICLSECAVELLDFSIFFSKH